MTSLLLFTLSVSLAPAAPTPHRLHWCAGLFAARPEGSTPVASDPRAVNEMNARVDEARRHLNDRDIGPTLRNMRKLLNKVSGDDAEPIAFAVKDLSDRRQVEKRIFTIDRLTERLRRIAHAATRLDEDTISFGQVIRGQAAIDDYTARVAAEAARLDADDALGVNPPYRRARNWLVPTVWGAGRAWLGYAMFAVTAELFTRNDYGMGVFAALVTTFWADRVIRSASEVVSYLAGLRNVSAREYYLNHFAYGRQHDFPARLTKVSTAVVDGPRPLAYSSIAVVTTSDKIDKMLSGAGRPVLPRAPPTADDDGKVPVITPDYRRVLIDFVS